MHGLRETMESKDAHNEALRRIEECRLKGREGYHLNLAGLGLDQVPAQIGSLRSLRSLDLTCNRLSRLPSEISGLKELETLDLRVNELTHLPLDVATLVALSRLLAGSNRLATIPPIVMSLTQIEVLDFDRNDIEDLGPEIFHLRNLRRLSLTGNQLTRLPPQIGHLHALVSLAVGSNRLKCLPCEIGDLKNLEELFAWGNEMESLPPELGRCSSLKELSLRSNQLRNLPIEIGQLGKLETLDLNGNLLTCLPSSLGGLSYLERLNLEDNVLTSLPRELCSLNQLKQLTLHGNEELRLPPEALGLTNVQLRVLKDTPADPSQILNYYFNRHEQGEAAMQELRLLLVGRGRVGKTTLLKALRGQKVKTDEPETAGITVLPLKLSCDQGDATAHVWDFGGQEFLHGTHQIFLSERCVYVLVLEGREGNWESETDYWLRFIQSFGGDSPVIVVLTKFDTHAFTVDQFRMRERCPQIVGFVETDAITRRGIPELRQLISNTVNSMQHVWLGVPKRWHQIKEQLNGMRENYLEYRDYQRLCVERGVPDADQQDSLAQTLHRLGMALNFRDHHRLRETSVLKPQWVTEAIYGLLRYAQQQKCHGVFNRSWFRMALSAKNYPAEMHAFVLELMEKFEVAFPLEKEGTQRTESMTWLIPELLSEVQPEAFIEFRGDGVKRLRFTYPEALPPGLLPRLIVRTHEMSSAHPQWRWRAGVVLEWNDCRALVRLDRQLRQTTVEVIDSPPKMQQSLFDLVRAELVILHGKVKVLEELELPGHPGTWVSADKLRLLEQRGRTETEETTKENDLATVPVTPTLNTVESPEARRAGYPNPPERMRLFVSYAHADRRLLKPLGAHLKILGRRGYIQVWEDKQLIAGEEWEPRILEELEQADIVLLMYSTAARASDFIQDKEMPLALRRDQDKQCTLIPVPLDRNDCDDSHGVERELAKLMTGTWKARRIVDFQPRGDGWQQVETAIREAVMARRARR